MRRSPRILAGFLAVVSLAACRGRAPERSAPRGPNPRPIERERYTPPADGRLRAEQIGLYVRVLRREAERRAPPPPPAEARKSGMSLEHGIDVFLPPDTAAARDLGINTEEFAWVKERIVETETALDARDNLRASLETYRRSLATLRSTRDKVADRKIRATLDSQMTALEQESARTRRELAQQPSPASQFNQELVARHRDEIRAAEQVASAR
jgi:hypothetical protein